MTSRGTTRFPDPAASATVEAMAAKEKEQLRKALSAFFERQAALGLTRTELCRKAKVSEGTVRDFLKSRTKTVQHDTLEKLAAAAGVTVYDILGSAATVGKAGEISREHMRALLAEMVAFIEREGIQLQPQQFADLAMVLYSVSIQANPAAFKMTAELESIIRLAGRGSKG